MIKLPNMIHVRTRLPLSAWAVAALLTIFSLMSSALHLSPEAGSGRTRIEQATGTGKQPGNWPNNSVMAATGVMATIR
jgi:hypothetical protein